MSFRVNQTWVQIPGLKLICGVTQGKRFPFQGLVSLPVKWGSNICSIVLL